MQGGKIEIIEPRIREMLQIFIDYYVVKSLSS